MPSVNLVPIEYLTAHKRRRRMQMWATVVGGVALLAGITLGRLVVVDQVARHAERHLARLQADKVDLLQRIKQAESQRSAAAAQALVVLGLQREHPLPGRLLTVFRDMPPGIVLERLEAAPPGQQRRRDAFPTPTAGADDSMPVHLYVHGVARAHQDVDALIACFEDIPAWRQVDLVRVAQQPYNGAEAIGFQLECRPLEEPK